MTASQNDETNYRLANGQRLQKQWRLMFCVCVSVFSSSDPADTQHEPCQTHVELARVRWAPCRTAGFLALRANVNNATNFFLLINIFAIPSAH